MGLFGSVFGGGGVNLDDTLPASAPYFKRLGAKSQSTGGSVSPSVPAHVEDDLLLCIVEANYGGSGVQNSIVLDSAEGFVAVAGTPFRYAGSGGSTGGTQAALYWKRATSSSTPPPTVSSSNDHIVAWIVSVGGVKDFGNPINAVATGSALVATSFTGPGLTTTVNNCLVLSMITTATDSASTAKASEWANADLVDVHEILDDGTTNGGGGGVVAAVGILETAGVAGDFTATSSAFYTSAKITIALEPRRLEIGAAADETAPVITNLSPAAGADIRSTTVITFDVTDETALMIVAILASFPDGSCEVVHDGDTFRGNYVGSANVRTEIAYGYTFAVRRDGGWTQSPTFEYLVLDGGNLGEIS